MNEPLSYKENDENDNYIELSSNTVEDSYFCMIRHNESDEHSIKSSHFSLYIQEKAKFENVQLYI